MNIAAIILVIIVIIIIVITIIVYIKYKDYKKNFTNTYDTLLTINVKNKETGEEGTFMKTLNITNPEIQNINYMLNNIDDNFIIEMDISNDNNRTINGNITCKNNLDTNLFINSLIDVLKKINITQMTYKGNMYYDIIKKEIDSSKMKEENHKLIVDNMNLSILYITDFDDYKNRDIAEDNKEYVASVEKETQSMINKTAESFKKIKRFINKDNDDSESSDSSDDEYENIKQPETFTEALEMMMKKEQKKYKFVKSGLENKLYIYINFVLTSSGNEIKKRIIYPIYSYTGYKEIEFKVDTILENYKGLIAKREYISDGKLYELHYGDDKNIEIDYSKIYDELKNTCCLILNYNNDKYVYQSTDLAQFKRYLSKLEENEIEVDEIDEYEDFNVYEGDINNLYVIDMIQ